MVVPFTVVEVLFGLWGSRCDLRSVKHVLKFKDSLHVFMFFFFARTFNLWVFLKIPETPKKLTFCFPLQTDRFGGFLNFSHFQKHL